MLASFVLGMRPRALAPVGRTVGRSLHALFLNLVRQADAELAEALHADARSKPFTVSMLRGRFVRRGDRALASPDEVYRVRFSVLAEPVFRALSQGLVGKQLRDEAVVIDGQAYDVVEVGVEPGRTEGWGQLSSYEQVWGEAQAESRVILQFASPTTFHQGDVNLLFPLPVSVWGSYWRRWQAWGPAVLDDDGLLDFVAEHVVAERYELATRIVSYGQHQFNGCVGVCQYRVMGGRPSQVRTVNALADLALFAGTGQKTTQGLGQTRRVADVRVRMEGAEWVG